MDRFQLQSVFELVVLPESTAEQLGPRVVQQVEFALLVQALSMFDLVIAPLVVVLLVELAGPVVAERFVEQVQVESPADEFAVLRAVPVLVGQSVKNRALLSV